MKSKLSKHFDKDNPHHAYLIEGNSEETIPQIMEFVEILGVKTKGNPDFYNISLDSFKMEDARNLKSFVAEKGFSSDKKTFVIYANSFLLEAQNALLKMFEEPTESTIFFLVVPDTNTLLRTLVSRFYLIKNESEGGDLSEAERFIKMPLQRRIDYIKDFIESSKKEEEKGGESTRTKSLKFLNTIEVSLHDHFVKNSSTFEQIFKVREYLRQPGSSAKNLLESLALAIPVL